MIYFTKEYLNFFTELEINNNREWFESKKERYKIDVEKPFHLFIDTLLDSIKKIDSRYNLSAKECVFRIYRDVRFSKDKTPYKIRMSALLAPGGRKDFINPGLYIELGADEIKIFSGLYEIEKEQLNRLRLKISKNLNLFKSLINEKEFIKKYKEILGEKAKRIDPKLQQYAEKEPLILNKQFYFCCSQKSTIALKPGLDNWVLECYNSAKKVNDFLID